MSSASTLNEAPSPPSPTAANTAVPVSAGVGVGFTMPQRLLVAAAVLTLGALVQIGLLLHVRAGGAPPVATLESPLKKLPLKLGKWEGHDIEITDRNALYGNEHVKREYVLEGGKQRAAIWMVYSRVGLDRDHHPEVCFAVSGKREIPGARKPLNVDELSRSLQTKEARRPTPFEEPQEADGAPIQVFCFGDDRQAQWVYYWNYTLPTPSDVNLDVVRRTYHRMRTRPASVTVEVFSDQRRGQKTDELDALVAQLDLELKKIVGARAVRSSERKPFTILKTAENEQPE